MRVCCGLDTVLVAGETALNKRDLGSTPAKPRVWKKSDILQTVTQVTTVFQVQVTAVKEPFGVVC